jgi:hypothetical protein
LWREGEFFGGYSITAPGGVYNNGAIGGNTLSTDGDVTTIVGDYTQENDGHLFIRIGAGPTGAGSDRLAVTGEANLDGMIDLLLINPPTATSFTILTAPAGVTGRWDNANTSVLVDGHRYMVNYLPTSVQLSLVPEPAAIAIAAAFFFRRRR